VRKLNEITAAVALWILASWRQTNSQLLFSATRIGSGRVWPASILRTDSMRSIVSVAIRGPAEQNQGWTIPLERAKFLFGVVSELTQSLKVEEDSWVSFLSIKLPGGDLFTLGERLT
jgi:hypothetical protein